MYGRISGTGIFSSLSCYGIILYVKGANLGEKDCPKRSSAVKTKCNGKNNGLGSYLFGIHMFVSS